MNKLSRNLQHKIDTTKIKQAELAEKVGLSQVMIHKLLSGKSKSSTKVIEMAKVLGCSPEWLLKGEIGDAEENLFDPNVTLTLIPNVTIDELKQGISYLKSIDANNHPTAKIHEEADVDWIVDGDDISIIDPVYTNLTENPEAAFSFEKRNDGLQCYRLTRNNENVILTGIEQKVGFDIILTPPRVGESVNLSKIEHEFLGSIVYLGTKK